MTRLCERPGCSQPAAAAYRLEASERSVSVTPLDEDAAFGLGVLCARHADALVVPLGWVLDDRREPVPRLFRPPAPVTAEHHVRPRPKPRHVGGDPAQLEFGSGEPPRRAPSVARAVVEAPWQPRFDPDDDLDGLLRATGPLLSRAFRGVRPTTKPSVALG